MRLSILGPVEASVDGRPVALGGAKQRAVLAMLGLDANRAVPADRLIEGLWGEQPPPSAANMVQNYVWRLRRTLGVDGEAEIVTRGRGYELRIDRGLVDVCRLEWLVSEAIVDVASLRRRAILPGSETVRSLARFTPDGRFLVGGSFEGWARLWSTDTWRPATRKLAGHAAEVAWGSVSPDGRTLATGSTDGTTRLFDLATQRPVGAPLPGPPKRQNAPLLAPDGNYLFVITDAGRAYRWEISPSSWAHHACKIAGRRLSRTEWNELLPERDYTPAC